MRYKQTSTYNHDEVPARKNLKTGRFQELKKRPNNLPEGKQTFGKDEVGWAKSYNASWEYLDEVLTDLEFRVVNRLCRMAQKDTNSLQPLDDETTSIELSEYFSIDRRKALKMFEKLFDLGVYGKFSVKKVDIPYTKYWVLNPYLVFQGKFIVSDIAELFKGTKLTNEYYRRMSLK